MTFIKQVVVRLVRDEDGQDLIEYALLAAFIALACIAAAQSLGTTLGNVFSNINNQIKTAPGGS